MSDNSRAKQTIPWTDAWSCVFLFGVGLVLTAALAAAGTNAVTAVWVLPAVVSGAVIAALGFWAGLRGQARRDADGAAEVPQTVARLIGSDRDSVTILNGDGTIRHGGHAFGISEEPASADGSSVDRFRLIHPMDRDGVYDWLATVMGDEDERADHRFRVLDDTGTYTAMSATAVNLLTDRTVGGLVIISRRSLGALDVGHASSMSNDELTGLPNRRKLLSELAECVPAAAADGLTTAILFLDLDRFKVVNDSLGADYGDALLTVVARQIVQAVRPDDIVARIGADEFVVVCRNLEVPDEAEGLAHRLMRVLSEPIPVLDRPITTSASIGLGFARPGDAPEAVLRDAGIAMERAKQSGGNRIEVFDDVLRERITRRLDTEQELRRALRANELMLLFQPIVSLTEGLVATEALVRWNHPVRGLLGPGEFITVAEETGLILGLGDWVLAEACRTLAEWTELMGDAAPNMTVNLSMRQIVEPSFVSRVRLHIAESGIAPEKLILEVTEDSLVNELDRCIPVLSELAALGLGIAIDDFGTGLSSLSHVKRLPMARTIKIDRSFVTDIHEYRTDHAIVQAVLVMAERLGIRVVAEGVETNDQLSALVELGCKYLQGYFFSPPLEASGIVAFDPEAIRVHGIAMGLRSDG